MKRLNKTKQKVSTLKQIQKYLKQEFKLTTSQANKITVISHVLNDWFLRFPCLRFTKKRDFKFFINEEENVDIEWARLMAIKPPALETVRVKPEAKDENVDVSANSEVSSTLDLDF